MCVCVYIRTFRKLKFRNFPSFLSARTQQPLDNNLANSCVPSHMPFTFREFFSVTYTSIRSVFLFCCSL